MDFNSRTRQQRINRQTKRYCDWYEKNHGCEERTVRFCEEVLAAGDEAVNQNYIVSFVDAWNSKYAAKDRLTSRELIRAILLVLDDAAERLEEYQRVCEDIASSHWELRLISGSIEMSTPNESGQRASEDSGSARPEFGVINGGRSKNPDSHYVDMNNAVLEYPEF